MPNSQQFPIKRVRDAEPVDAADAVAVEEPMEIRLGFSGESGREEKSISVTMRTPGSDDELAAGFLFGEGIIASAPDVVRIWHRSPPVPGSDLRNVIRVDLSPATRVDLDRLERHFYTTSSCGVCGKASIDALRVQNDYSRSIQGSTFRIHRRLLHALPDKLSAEQKVFGETGGLHAAGFFDERGGLSLVREDVGRHNALDKLIGRLFLDDQLPAMAGGVLVSGRSSFELMQKVAMAGCPMLAAVGAPSSLAVELAQEFGITLVGFLRDGRFNIYSCEERVLTG